MRRRSKREARLLARSAGHPRARTGATAILSADGILTSSQRSSHSLFSSGLFFGGMTTAIRASRAVRSGPFARFRGHLCPRAARRKRRLQAVAPQREHRGRDLRSDKPAGDRGVDHHVFGVGVACQVIFEHDRRPRSTAAWALQSAEQVAGDRPQANFRTGLVDHPHRLGVGAAGVPVADVRGEESEKRVWARSWRRELRLGALPTPAIARCFHSLRPLSQGTARLRYPAPELRLALARNQRRP